MYFLGIPRGTNHKPRANRIKSRSTPAHAVASCIAHARTTLTLTSIYTMLMLAMNARQWGCRGTVVFLFLFVALRRPIRATYNGFNPRVRIFDDAIFPDFPPFSFFTYPFSLLFAKGPLPFLFLVFGNRTSISTPYSHHTPVLTPNKRTSS